MIFIILFSIDVNVFGQKEEEIKQIEIINSDLLSIEKNVKGSIRILNGNVELRHDTLTLYCDSAKVYSENNFVEAFSKVKIITPNGTSLDCDKLTYDGINKILELYQNIILTNGTAKLETQRLTYNRITGIGKYFQKGKLTQPKTSMVSNVGIYDTKKDQAYFTKNVVYQNSELILLTDTLDYDTKFKIATFKAPTHIKTKDSTFAYTERGYYNSVEKEIYLHRNPFLKDTSYSFYGDTIFYNDSTKTGWAKCNIFIISKDSNQIMGGEYGLINRQNNFAQIYSDSYAINRSVEKNKKTQQPTSAGESMVIFADTLTSETTVTGLDSISRRVLKAVQNVKISSKSFSAICDSLIYYRDDSIFYLYKEPIVWSDSSQLSGDTIVIWTGKNKIDSLAVRNNSFALTKVDSIFFDQLQGNNLNAKFDNKNQIIYLGISGNAESIYTVKDEKKYVGLNKSVSKRISIFFEKNKPQKIIFIEKPSAIFYPIHEVWLNPPKLGRFKDLKIKKPKKYFETF